MIRGSGIKTEGALDAQAVRELCDTRKAIDKMRLALDQILAVQREIRDLLQDNLIQSQAVSEDLRAAAKELCESGCDLRDELKRRP